MTLSTKHSTICIHSQTCGGCALQHLPEQEYYHIKRNILLETVKRLGYAPEILADMLCLEPKSRRRAEFKIAVNKGSVALGFCEEKSNRVVDISMCEVVQPQIFVLGQKIKTLFATLKKAGNFDGVNITHIDDVFDVYFLVKSPIHHGDKESLIAFAKENNITRLGEKIGNAELQIFFNLTSFMVNFGSAKIELPAGAFLQATEAAQTAITDFILQHIGSAKNIVDLYSGCGTYSFPLAQAGSHVDAYEGSYEMAFALNAAARKNNLEKNLQAQSRDLYKKPLRADELKNYDAIVLNPPRNGALPQCQQIAKSGVQKIVMVSCNPATFERDAKCLLGGGYKLQQVLPIDQFLWSNHLELAAYFILE